MPEPQFYRHPKFTAAGYINMTGSYLTDNVLEEEPDFGAWKTKMIIFQKFSQYQRSWQKLNPVKVNAVTQTNTIENEADQVKEMIFQAVRRLSVPYTGTLVNRLFELFHDAKEEERASVGISIGSLRTFYNFMQSCPNLKCPVISLTPEYNIYASWKAARNKVFSVHFLPGDDVRFVIFTPNNIHTNKLIRLSGMATADVLIKTVEPYGVLNWACDEG